MSIKQNQREDLRRFAQPLSLLSPMEDVRPFLPLPPPFPSLLLASGTPTLASDGTAALGLPVDAAGLAGVTVRSNRECIALDQRALRTRSASQGVPKLAALESRVSTTCDRYWARGDGTTKYTRVEKRQAKQRPWCRDHESFQTFQPTPYYNRRF